MDILQIFIELVGSFAQRADNDRSIVGESPMEEETARFWHRLLWTLLLAAGVAALYVWVLKERLAI